MKQLALIFLILVGILFFFFRCADAPQVEGEDNKNHTQVKIDEVDAEKASPTSHETKLHGTVAGSKTLFLKDKETKNETDKESNVNTHEQTKKMQVPHEKSREQKVLPVKEVTQETSSHDVPLVEPSAAKTEIKQQPAQEQQRTQSATLVEKESRAKERLSREEMRKIAYERRQERRSSQESRRTQRTENAKAANIQREKKRTDRRAEQVQRELERAKEVAARKVQEETDRVARDKLELEKRATLEAQRVAMRKKAEQERAAILKQQKIEREATAVQRAAREKAAALLAAQQASEKRLAEEKAAAEKIAREKAATAEKERLREEKEAAEVLRLKQEAEAKRLTDEKAEAEKVAAEQQRLAEKKAEAARQEQERLAKEKAVAEERARQEAAIEAIKEAKKKLFDTFSLTKVEFKTNKALLTQESKELLNKVAIAIKKHPNFRYNIQGHTDATGNEDYNINLSTKRAQRVKTYLIEQGVDSTLLSSEGFGSSMPIADNATREGRLENRRVVFKILE